MILVCDNGRGGQTRLGCLRCLMSNCTQLIPATSSGGKLSSKGHTYFCSREKDSRLDMYIYTSIISCQYVYTCTISCYSTHVLFFCFFFASCSVNVSCMLFILMRRSTLFAVIVDKLERLTFWLSFHSVCLSAVFAVGEKPGETGQRLRHVLSSPQVVPCLCSVGDN